MAAKKFRFVSPGVKINEIDRSRVPTLPGQIGPVVIGRSVKGPSMVPVTVNSYEEFVQKFGEPSPGLGSNDIWRNGNDTAPTYGAYAAQAWLASSSPLTFVKLAGVKADGASAEGLPGWKTDNVLSTTTSSNGGAIGLFIAKSGSAETGSLAAIFYVQTGSIILSGTTADGATQVEGSCTSIKSIKTNRPEFRLKIKNGSDSVVEDVIFDLDKNSNKFIRKVFNTNPTLTNSRITDTGVLKPYWLGETFEDFIEELGLHDDDTVAFVAGLQSGSAPLGNFEVEAQPAKSGWVISQHLSDNTGSFDPATGTVSLFRIVAGEGLGSDWEQNNYKVSIFDIKPPRSAYQKYGTFSVGIRNMEDTDKSPEFVEVFSNLTLDPNSPDYIAARIGDRRVVWNVDADGEGRYVELGDYENNSRLVRVEMHPAAAGVDGGLLPAGFFGPTRYKQLVVAAAGTITETGSVVSKNIPGVVNAGKTIETYGQEIKVVFPRVAMVTSASAAGLLDETRAFFGMESADPMDQSLKDILKVKPSGYDSHVVGSNAALEYSSVFTLDDVVYDSSSSSSYWQEGSRKAGTSRSAVTSFTDLIETLEYNRFTMPLVGGFDGLDIVEKDTFNNTKLSISTDEKLNFALHSVKRAVNSLKDPEVLDMNLLVAPGIHNEAVVNQMLRVCENRADCLAIVDVNSGYKTDAETKDDASTRLGDTATVVSNVKGKFNSSYGCAYYPWVQIRDSNTGIKLWIPPSIPAFGTMASSQENSEVWFAPAGFNRGGLSLGSSGLNVVSVRDKLTSKNRDALYERNINPIASFPSEGIVIFGQKTLQAFPSALDRINVRRLVIFLKKEISRIASNVLFEPNVQDTWRRFISPATTLLESVKGGLGIAEYRLVLDETTTTPEEIDRNMMYAKLFIKPVYAIEFIGIDFIITNTGASFDDV
jgi:hypothetical protein